MCVCVYSVLFRYNTVYKYIVLQCLIHHTFPKNITTPSGSTLVVSLLNRILQELHDGGLGAMGFRGDFTMPKISDC